MSVNGVTSSQAAAAYSYSATESVKADTKAAETAASKETSKSEETSADKGVVYEQSGAKDNVGKPTYKPDTNLINKMKADADARTAQLRSLVEKMMTGQATAYGKANDIWSFLRSGNYTVDPATKAQAQADIAEDGYWGVNQTSPSAHTMPSWRNSTRWPRKRRRPAPRRWTPRAERGDYSRTGKGPSAMDCPFFLSPHYLHTASIRPATTAPEPRPPAR